MLDFVARVFRAWMNVILWITLVGCAVGGAIFGWVSSGEPGYALVGLIGGGLVGLIINVLGGGFIANFLDMVDNIAYIRMHLPHGSSSGPAVNLSNVPPINPTVVNSEDSWVCKKCNERNPNTAASCKGCGEYK